ncbi:MAG: DUF1345 domain-containing protein [Betaproteobacteria bacterium]|nr:MAG: DUF1345 domain-containing protein [Betaproteobacteria bacterium]TMH02529.1 MAG: DUF1345 domain-containing protein [Betaproteobacteria bacterium]
MLRTMSPLAPSVPPEPKLPWVVGLSAPRRLLVTLVIGVISFAATRPWLDLHARLLIAWSAGALTYLSFAWLAVGRADAAMTRVRAQLYDQTGYVIFMLIVVASSASVVAIGFIIGDAKQLPFPDRAAHLSLSILALLLSWLLIQTLFAFHYARCYYWRENPTNDHIRGLRFPGETEPDYLDFVYYSFVVGMTSQVSDVAVVARHMRRLTLIHGVLSFVFNIAILAMGINIVGGMI